jgi:hypothetical protein
MYTPVVTRPVLGARPFGASLRLFKIVPDDFVAPVRLALPSLVTFLKHALRVVAKYDLHPYASEPSITLQPISQRLYQGFIDRAHRPRGGL